MMSLLVPISLTIFISLILYTIVFIGCEIEKDKEPKHIISFKNFLNLHAINPIDWLLFDDYVTYKNVDFSFSKKDRMRYRRWYHNYNKKIYQERTNAELVQCFKEWQKDIESYREKNIKDMAKSLKELENNKKYK